MAKVKFKDYKYYDLSKTDIDISVLSAEEKQVYIDDTLAVLSAYKKSISKANPLLCLAAGLLELRGGEFIHINGYRAKYKEGNCTRNELKVIKKVFRTCKIFFCFKAIIVVLSRSENQTKTIWAHIAKKIAR